jgi:hypothetical protein
MASPSIQLDTSDQASAPASPAASSYLSFSQQYPSSGKSARCLFPEAPAMTRDEVDNFFTAAFGEVSWLGTRSLSFWRQIVNVRTGLRTIPHSICVHTGADIRFPTNAAPVTPIMCLSLQLCVQHTILDDDAQLMDSVELM